MGASAPHSFPADVMAWRWWACQRWDSPYPRRHAGGGGPPRLSGANDSGDSGRPGGGSAHGVRSRSESGSQHGRSELSGGRYVDQNGWHPCGHPCGAVPLWSGSLVEALTDGRTGWLPTQFYPMFQKWARGEKFQLKINSRATPRAVAPHLLLRAGPVKFSDGPHPSSVPSKPMGPSPS